MDIKNKDFEIDTDLLNKYFEQLSLEHNLLSTLKNLDSELEHNHFVESHNGYSAEECFSCENKLQRFDFDTSTENDFKIDVKLENDVENKDIKIENDEGNIDFPVNVSKQVSLNEEKVPLAFIKEEVESEPSTDSSSSDEENVTTLLERGGKEKTKKRSHKKKVYKREDYVSAKEIDSVKLCHGNSGLILQDNSELFPVQASLLTNYSSAYLDFPTSSSNESWSINSPESGYDTSQSNGHSPSPPIVESASSFDHDGKKKFMEIYCSILETAKQFDQRTNSQKNSIIPDPYYNSTGQIANKAYDPKNLEGTAGILENGYASLNYSDSDFVNTANLEAQNTDEDLAIFIDYFNEHCNSQNNQSMSETTGPGLEISDSVTDQTSMLHCRLHEQCNSQNNLIIGGATGSGLEISVRNQTPMFCSKPAKQEESFKRKISPNVKDSAKRALRDSEVFDREKYKVEEEEILRKIQRQRNMKKTVKIIDYDEREEYKNLQQTNLHSAVIESNIEKVYCIVEALKRFGPDLFDINNKDANKKTALDYAVKKNMSLLINYLKENNAVQAVECYGIEKKL